MLVKAALLVNAPDNEYSVSAIRSMPNTRRITVFQKIVKLQPFYHWAPSAFFKKS